MAAAGYVQKISVRGVRYENPQVPQYVFGMWQTGEYSVTKPRAKVIAKDIFCLSAWNPWSYTRFKACPNIVAQVILKRATIVLEMTTQAGLGKPAGSFF